MKQKTYREKVKNLETQIELNFNNIIHLPTLSETYQVGERIIRGYAMQYQQLTGQPYIRDWAEEKK